MNTSTLITPHIKAPEIAKDLDIPKLFLKREDLHPYGSHKGRSIPVMIDMKIALGSRDFVLSSSGNAALAAVRHIQKRNEEADAATPPLSLSILIGKHINAEKKQHLLSEIHDSNITLTESERPLKLLLEKIKGGGRKSLRQSTDDSALIGYQALAEELSLIPDLSHVFIGSSSGTTAQALASYFSVEHPHVHVHIVQTTSCSPLVDALKNDERKHVALASTKEISLADAIVDKTAHRRESVSTIIRQTDGSGFIATNEDILKAQILLNEKAHIETTANGALGLAGLLVAQKAGIQFKGAVVCIITGK